MSKLSDVVKNDVAKKTVHVKLAAKVNNIDTIDFVLKTASQTDKTELEQKIPRTGLDKNVIIFEVDMSSSTKIDNRKKDILILGRGPTQGLEHTLSAEKMYLINFT